MAKTPSYRVGDKSGTAPVAGAIGENYTDSFNTLYSTNQSNTTIITRSLSAGTWLIIVTPVAGTASTSAASGTDWSYTLNVAGSPVAFSSSVDLNTSASNVFNNAASNNSASITLGAIHHVASLTASTSITVTGSVTVTGNGARLIAYATYIRIA